jgi:hypothetical protein
MLIKETPKILQVYTGKPKTIENFVDFNELPKIPIHTTTGNFLKSYESKTHINLCDDIL